MSDCSNKCHICERGYVDKTSPFYCSRSGDKEYIPACKGLILSALSKGIFQDKTDEMVNYLKSLGVSEERIELFKG